MWLGVGQWGWSGIPKTGHTPVSWKAPSPLLSRVPARVFQGVAEGPREGGARAPGRRPRGHITGRRVPPWHPPHSPGGGALAPALGGRAGAGRGDSSQRAAGAGSPAVSAGLRGSEEARAGRTRWPGAAATTAAVVLGECSIHPSPTPGVSVGSQEAGSPPNPAAAAALRGRW